MKHKLLALLLAGALLLVCGACQSKDPTPSAADELPPTPTIEITPEPTPVPTANPSNDTLWVDGVAQFPTAYKIGSANYLQLRDVAMLLSGTPAQFSVDYDNSRKAVVITTGEPYTPQGWELGGAAASSIEALPSNNDVYINGVKTDFTVFKIDGSNFFQIRALGQALGFNVSWLKGIGVYIESDKPYSEVDTPTSQECVEKAKAAMANRDSATALVWLEKAESLDPSYAEIKDCLDILSLFDNTPWQISWGQTNGTNYYTRFYIDGTYDYTGIAGEPKTGHYTYEDRVLRVDTLEQASFIRAEDGFRSTEQYKMMSGKDYYSIIPDPGNRYDMYIAIASTPPEPTPTPTPTPTPIPTPVPTPAPTSKVLSDVNISDEALLEFANSRLFEQYFFKVYLSWGAIFEQDWNSRVRDENGRDWFLIIDPKVSSLADLQTVWEEYFAKSYSIPDSYLSHYREFSGRLYSDCEGVGGDMGYLGMELTAVASRDNQSALLTGEQLREDWEGNGTYQYSVPIEYRMVYEDGEWKCAGIELKW